MFELRVYRKSTGAPFVGKSAASIESWLLPIRRRGRTLHYQSPCIPSPQSSSSNECPIEKTQRPTRARPPASGTLPLGRPDPPGQDETPPLQD
jgi:hypothetical protein